MGVITTISIAKKMFPVPSDERDNFIKSFNAQIIAINSKYGTTKQDVMIKRDIIKMVYERIDQEIENGHKADFVDSNGKIKIEKISAEIKTSTERVEASYKNDSVQTGKNQELRLPEVPTPSLDQEQIKDYTAKDFSEWQENVKSVIDALDVDSNMLEKALKKVPEMLLALGLTEKEFLDRAEKNNRFIDEVIKKHPEFELVVKALLAKYSIDLYNEIVPKDKIDDVASIMNSGGLTDEEKIIKIQKSMPGISDDNTQKIMSVQKYLSDYKECVNHIMKIDESTGFIQQVIEPYESKEELMGLYAAITGMEKDSFENLVDMGVPKSVVAFSIKETSTSVVKLYECINLEGLFTEEEILSKMSAEELQEAKNSLAQHLGIEEITVEMMLESDEMLLALDELAFQEQAKMQEQQDNTDARRDSAIESTINGISESLKSENFSQQDIQLAFAIYRDIISQIPQDVIEQGLESIESYFRNEVQNYELTGNSSAIFQMLSGLNYSGRIQEILQTRRDELISALENTENQREETVLLSAGSQITDKEGDLLFQRSVENIVTNGNIETRMDKKTIESEVRGDPTITSIMIISFSDIVEKVGKLGIRQGQVTASRGLLEGVLVGKGIGTTEIDNDDKNPLI